MPVPRLVVVLRLFVITGFASAFTHAVAADVRLALYEKATKQTDFFDLDLESGKVLAAASSAGDTLSSISKYSVRNRMVTAPSGVALAEAEEVLCQSTLDDLDVLVVRQEYNSANPLYWLAAFSGHPVQVSKIVWLEVKGGKLIHSQEIVRKPASYHWHASLMQPPSQESNRGLP